MRKGKKLLIAFIALMLLVAALISSISGMMTQQEQQRKAKSKNDTITEKYLYTRIIEKDADFSKKRAGYDDVSILLTERTDEKSDSAKKINMSKTEKDKEYGHGTTKYLLSSGSATSSFNGNGDYYTGTVTYYDDGSEGARLPNNKTTATGLPVEEGLCAVDPNLIPYGSILYIQQVDKNGNPGGVTYGYALAADTGGFTNSVSSSDNTKAPGTYSSKMDPKYGTTYPRLVDVWAAHGSLMASLWKEGVLLCNIYVVKSGGITGASAKAKNQAKENYDEWKALRNGSSTYSPETDNTINNEYTIKITGPNVESNTTKTINLSSLTSTPTKITYRNGEAKNVTGQVDVDIYFWVETVTTNGISEGSLGSGAIDVFHRPEYNELNPFGPTNPNYENDGIHKNNYGMPNCTAFAWGRFKETSGISLALIGGEGSAKYWYGRAQVLGMRVGKTPKVGAIACWNDGNSGHVAIVEAIDKNGNIIWSESGYSSFTQKSPYYQFGPYSGTNQGPSVPPSAGAPQATFEGRIDGFQGYIYP